MFGSGTSRLGELFTSFFRMTDVQPVEARPLLTLAFSLLRPIFSECLHVLEGHTSTIRCIKVLQGRPIAVSGSRDASIRVWDLENGRLLHLLAGHDQSVRCIEVSGNKVVSGSYDCTCRVS
jgi:WD40 repeat protein